MNAEVIGAGLGALSSLFGFMSNNANQMLSYNSNKKLQENQAKLNYEYAEKSALNSPSWNRQGLVNAGYNPMLAVSNATSGANSSWTSSAHADTPTSPDYLSTGIANAVDFQRLKNETEQVQSTINAQDATARNQNAEASNKEAENPFISRREQANIGRMSAETSKLQRETEYFDALEKNLEEMRRIQEMGINVDFLGRKYSADRAYNASTYSANRLKESSIYSSDVIERNNRRDNRLRRNMPQLPFGIKFPRGYYQPSFSELYYDR